MSVPKSLLAYTDCIDYFDTALRFSEGCRIPLPDYEFGIRLRMRLNYCRKLDRDNNAKLYAEGHKMHGTSQYDKITCVLEQFEAIWYLMLKRNDLMRMPIEGLGQELDPLLKAPTPQLQIAAPSEMEELEVIKDDEAEAMTPGEWKEEGDEAVEVEAEIKTAEGWRRL